MPDTEFRLFRARRESYIRGLDGVETLLLIFAFLWAIELIFLPKGYTSDPISNALQNLLPVVPVRLHGWGLGTVCIVHAFASRWKWPDLRALCIMGETGFFLYAYWCIVGSGQYLPGLFCMPVFILFGTLDFASLLQPVEVFKWVRELKRGGSP